MIQILLVDDDARAINAIAANIDWQAAGIDKHYLAYNSSQAKQIMSEEKIDILLSDIEMPKGSGLELADWVKKNVGDVVCIFLTSYALFDYAREAIRLGSSDYILKPAPYETILQSINRAVEQVENNRLREIDTEQAELWNENHALVTERFWYDVATGAVSSDLRSIEELARSRHVDFRDQLIRPVLFELASVVNDEWEPGLLEKSLINILQELFLISDIVPVAFRLEPDNYLVLVGNELSEEELQTTC
jgi:two-component system response regulator YesN